MNEYFPREEGMGARAGCEPKTVLKIIATRFMADNPPVPVTYYLRSKDNFPISEDYMEEIALHEKFLELLPEQYIYAWAKLKPAQAGPFSFRFSAFGPVKIWVNGVLSFCTSHVQERFADQVSHICLDLKEGENSLFFQCVSTPLGCGFRIGSNSYKGRRIQFFSPDREHQGMSGFVYSRPYKKPVERIPELSEGEENSNIHWYPEISWKEDRPESVMERLFGDRKETGDGKEKGCQDRQGRADQEIRRKMVSAGKIFLPVPETLLFSGEVKGQEDGNGWGNPEGILWVDGISLGKAEGRWQREVRLSGGSHIIAFEGGETELSVSIKESGEILPVRCPAALAEGRELSWLYAGPFHWEQELDIEEMLTFRKPFLTQKGMSFWRADMPDVYLRPFNEGVLYGEWNYPLGVTLYGMIQGGRLLEDPAILSYVEGHMKKCAGFYDYCLWDQSFYGAAPFHNQLTTIDSLDDCGSFASAMLEVMKDHEIPDGEKIGSMVAAYVKHGQQRLEDGTFYRNHSYLPVMNETMWADDMYMSIPFLCRYYERSGDISFLRDAARQARGFFRYLYMPGTQIMSHIYDTHFQVQTEVPWGRGNGWVLFSLTELLAVMKETDPEREEILSIFRTLCQGYLKLQGEEGMWHQVLTVPDSYEETSCTAMFICGFARGVRYGWLEEKSLYAAGAVKGWQGLCEKAIDWKGNIYGVCRGSGYSFSKEYYANELSWNKNDTHGTGIVMLAGMEVEKMKQSMEERNGTDF